MNWIRTLYAKLAWGLVLILLFVGLFYSISITLLSQRAQDTATQQLNRNLARNLVDDQHIVHDGQLDIPAMKQTFMRYMSINPSIEIYYLDSSGKIISYSAEAGKVKRNSVDLGPIKAFLAGNNQFPLAGDDPRSHDRKKAFSVTPLPDAGYLYVVLQGEEFIDAQQAQSQSYILSLATRGLMGSLAFGLLVGLFIFRRLTLRLRKLQEKVTLFAESDFQNPIPQLIQNAPSQNQDQDQDQNNNGDEINELENRFQQMSQHISEQVAALQQQDQLRREMIASISHDLRTPLASTQGYLETIVLKYDDLSVKDKKQYLKIALQQTSRLQSLIDQLFDLAQLEARTAELSFESFSILELVYDVVNKFSLKAKQKNIHLSVSDAAVDSLVIADIALIERVLDNLIDNALQYTGENQHIWLEVSVDVAEKITVSVHDQGKGIVEAQKNLIFERFHRADNPHRSANGHAGLGLAIVKKIIELHDQNVWVESEPGKGSKFTFTLATGM